MKVELGLDFTDGPLAGLDLSIEVELEVDETSVRVFAAGPCEDSSKLGPHWTVIYLRADGGARWEPIPLSVEVGSPNLWSEEDGPLLKRPAYGYEG